MKRLKVILLSVAALLLLVLFLHEMKRAPIQELPTSLDGMELTIEQEIYTTSAEKIGINIHNHREMEFTGGTPGKFPIEKYMLGSWYKMPFKFDGADLAAITIPPGETAKMYTAVSELEVELTPGQYRALYGSMAVPFEVKE